jgi:hypothetical protein
MGVAESWVRSKRQLVTQKVRPVAVVQPQNTGNHQCRMRSSDDGLPSNRTHGRRQKTTCKRVLQIRPSAEVARGGTVNSGDEPFNHKAVWNRRRGKHRSVDEIVPYGVVGKIGIARHLHLLQYSGPIGTDRLDAEEQLFRDLRHGHAAR